MQYIKEMNYFVFGTPEEIANKLNVRKRTIWFWSSPANKKRAVRRRGESKRKIAIKIEDE